MWDGIILNKRLSKGCSQGSILGPILWKILFEDFLILKLEVGQKMIAYVDDALILIPRDSRVDIENKSRTAVSRVHGSCIDRA